MTGAAISIFMESADASSAAGVGVVSVAQAAVKPAPAPTTPAVRMNWRRQDASGDFSLQAGKEGGA